MAEVTLMRNNILGYPIYGLPYVLSFPLLDEDGDPVTGLTCDSEVSKNGNTAVDCHNEGVEIVYDTATNKGMYYLALTGTHTGTETAADVVAVTIYSGAATTQATCIVLYPKKLPKILSGTVGATGNDTTHAHIPDGVAINDFYNGCILHLNGAGNDECRMITDYVASTKLATLNLALDAAPTASTSTYDVYITDVAIAPILSLLVGMIPNAVAGAASGLAIVGSEMVVPDTQKVDIETIKTQAVTCSAGVTVLPSVGAASAQTATLDTIKAETVSILADTAETLTRLPNATAGATGGVFIAGSNAATTVAALTVTGALTSGTNVIPWNAAWDAEVQSECDDAITASAAITTIDTVVDSVLEAVQGIGTAGGAAINIDAHDDNVDGDMTDCSIDAINAEAFRGVQGAGAGLGTFTATSILDGTIHQITHSSNIIDIIYLLKIGGGTTPIGVVWTGRLNQSGDTCLIQAWDHVGAGWETIGTIAGQNNLTNNIVKNLILYPRHAGTSATELGHVYLRFFSDGTVTLQILKTDQLYVSYSVTARSVGYADGAVWVKDAGTAGVELYVNGTADNPCPYANAKTIAAALGLSKFRIINGETVTLDASVANKTFLGYNWTLALGNQAITNTYFEGATVTGTSTGDGAVFFRCKFGATQTIGTSNFHDCRFAGTFTTVAGKLYTIHQSVDDNPGGTDNAIFVLTAGTKMGFRDWSGGVQFNTIADGNTIVVDGCGRLILHTDCHAGGTVIVRGPFSVLDNATGGFEAEGGTLTQTERLSSKEHIADAIIAEVLSELSVAAPSATPTLGQAVMLPYMRLRNKHTATSSGATGAESIYNDAGVVIAKRDLTDDGTTFTKTELVSG